jgi:hypothetical protein
MSCSICGQEIPKPQFASHAEHCYRENEEMIRREAAQQVEPMFDHDTELQDWMKRRGTT